MSRQELASASGVSVRTITSFEDVSDRMPTPANLAAITLALQRLGVVFKGGGVGWLPPFSHQQIGAIRALSVRNDRNTAAVMDVMKESGCSRGDLEALTKLQIVVGIHGYLTLTPIGHHIPVLLRDHENRQIARQEKYGPISYTVSVDERAIFHAHTGAVFKIEDDGTLTLRRPTCVQNDEIEDVTAGAIEALRVDRERDPRVVGRFVWVG